MQIYRNTCTKNERIGVVSEAAPTEQTSPTKNKKPQTNSEKKTHTSEEDEEQGNPIGRLWWPSWPDRDETRLEARAGEAHALANQLLEQKTPLTDDAHIRGCHPLRSLTPSRRSTLDTQPIRFVLGNSEVFKSCFFFVYDKIDMFEVYIEWCDPKILYE